VISRNGKNHLGVSGSFLGAGLLAMTFMALPATASAAILTYQPSDPVMGDLDHHYIYSWRINGINTQIPAGQTIVSAALSFKQISNWNSDPNDLFVHLFDTAKNAGLTTQQEEPLSQTTDTPADELVGPTYTVSYPSANTPSTLFANNTANTFLFAQSFTTTPTDWTYNFTGAQVLALKNYIANGGDIALGLDPDCHFFNQGVTLTLTTGPLSTVPEPASLTLMGLGLAAWYRRRKTQAPTA
jgi:hypothetical protein